MLQQIICYMWVYDIFQEPTSTKHFKTFLWERYEMFGDSLFTRHCNRIRFNLILKLIQNVKIYVDTRSDLKSTWNTWSEIDSMTQMNTLLVISCWSMCTNSLCNLLSSTKLGLGEGINIRKNNTLLGLWLEIVIVCCYKSSCIENIIDKIGLWVITWVYEFYIMTLLTQIVIN